MKKYLFILLTLFLFIFSAELFSADYYWVGGSGNWSDTLHWATASGGSTFHSAPPSSDDNVFFNASSFSGPDTVTIDVMAECNNMDWTGAAHSPLITGMWGLRISGNMKCISAMSFYSTSISFDSDGIHTIDFGGMVLSDGGISFNGLTGDGVWTLLSDLTLTGVFSSIMLNNGTLITNGHTISLPGNIHVMGGAMKSGLYLGNSTVNCSGLNIMAPMNFTFDAGTSTINILNGSSSFSGNNYVFYDVNFFGLSFGSELYIGGSNSFHNLSFDSIPVIRFQQGMSQVIQGNITFNGSCGYPVTVISSESGKPAYLLKVSGTVSEDFLCLRDITAAGGGSFVSANSTNLGNVINWTITPPSDTVFYWVGGSGNWNDAGHWSFTSGGAPNNVCIPDAADDVVFNAASFTAPGQTVSIASEVFCKSMNWTGVTNNPQLNFGGFGVNLNLFGSLTLSAGMSLSGGSYIVFHGATAGNTITTNGIALSTVTFTGAGEYTFNDAATISSLYFEHGTLRTNNRPLALGSFNSWTNQSRQLYLGSSIITVTT